MQSGIYDLSGSFIPIENRINCISRAAFPKPCIAFIGAGGKTTTMFYIAKACAHTGKKVLVTTSTHIWRPSEEMAAYSPKDIEKIWERKLPAVIGTPGEEKWGSPDPGFFQTVYEKADMILIEADGSKQRPCKVLRDKEPVIRDCVTDIICVFGLSALGKTIGEAVYPPELAASALNTKEDHILNQQDIVILIQNYLNELAKKRIDNPIILLNQADTKEDFQKGKEIAILLQNFRSEQNILLSKYNQQVQCYLTHYEPSDRV